MKEEHVISYKAGITSKPSDFLCNDGELAECINLTTDAEELKVLPQPVAHTLTLRSSETLLYVHDLPVGKNYISRIGNNLYCNGANSHFGTVAAGELHISSVGRTLIVCDSNGLHYYLWGGSSYSSLGSKIPEPDVRFRITRVQNDEHDSGSFTGIMTYDDDTGELHIGDEHRKDVNDLMIGL